MTHSYPYNTDPTFGIEIEQFGCSKALCNRAIAEVLTEHGYTVTDYNASNVGAQGWTPFGGIRFVMTDAQYAALPAHLSAVHRATMTSPRVWTVKGDCSISTDSNQQRPVRGGMVPTRDRWEIVSPPMTYGEIAVCQAILRRLNKYGARVNTSCGLHVHLDARGMSRQTLVNVVSLAYKFDPVLAAGLQISDRRLGDSGYCQPVHKSFRDGVKRYWKAEKRRMARGGGGSDRDFRLAIANLQNGRYKTVNFHSLRLHGTVEFRLFDGTMHAGKLKTAIQTVYGLCSWAGRVSAVRGERRQIQEGRGRYTMRAGFCIHAGMMGPEFKTARKFLCAGLEGRYDGRADQRDLIGDRIDGDAIRRAENR